MSDESTESLLDRIERALDGKAQHGDLELLLARDAVEKARSKGLSAETCVRLFALDERLRARLAELAAHDELPAWRTALHPPESHWWWYPDARRGRAATEVVDVWDRLDWLWHGLTVGFLALATSFSVAMLQAVSADGISWVETFGTLLQGTGLALIGTGALTQGGQSRVAAFLDKLHIPSRFHAEFVLLVAVLACFLAWRAHDAWLPNFYEKSGHSAYENGDLAQAQEQIQKALALRDAAELRIDLGEVYESLHQLEPAMAQYRQALSSGDPDAFNHLGRAYLHWRDPQTQQGKPQLAESLLRLGLQRVASDDPTLSEVRYQLHRNLGWALLQQQRFDEAKIELDKAIAVDHSFPEQQIGTGMAECLLIDVYRQLGQPERRQYYRKECLHARPETINEYKWLIEIDERALSDCIDTTSIVTGRKPVCTAADEI